MNAAFADIHDSKITKQQLLIVLISGMGFFTDAYDLFVIGVAIKLMTKEWHLGTPEVSLLGSIALLSAAIGSLVFGRIADVFGRKLLYGVEVLVLAAGAFASAFAPNFALLVLFRFVLGLGIGGDYPVSATIASEFAGKDNRGRLIGFVFAMQGLGLIVGPLLALLFISNHVSEDLTWRLLLGLGGIPPLAVFGMRRRLGETPRFQKAQEEDEGKKRGFLETLRDELKDPQLGRWLVAASLSWFLLDIAYYGNTIMSPLILKSIAPKSTEAGQLVIQLVIFTLAALPGYLVAAFFMDTYGRKRIQLVGFAAMAVTFLMLAFVPLGGAAIAMFVILFALNYFFTECGPNTTTFVYPAEIFPVRVRTTSHGIAATTGKIGAALGAFIFPYLLSRFGVPGPMIAAGIVSAIGILTTLRLPEPMGQSLEDASRDRTFAGGAQPAAAPA